MKDGIFYGKLDRRITLQRLLVSRDEDNQPIEEWITLGTVWASATPVSDGERVRAAEVGATISMRFQIRWSSLVSDLNPKDRVICQGLVHDISGVKEIGRREGLEISAAAAADEVPSSISGLDFTNLLNGSLVGLI